MLHIIYIYFGDVTSYIIKFYRNRTVFNKLLIFMIKIYAALCVQIHIQGYAYSDMDIAALDDIQFINCNFPGI